MHRLQSDAGRIQPVWITPEDAERCQGSESMTPEQLIADSRPRGRESEARYEPSRYLSYLAGWYGRWSSRLMPDQETRREVVDAAERHFRKRGWNR